jgi:hypothetical protein
MILPMTTTTLQNNSSSATTEQLGALEFRLAGPKDREAVSELAERVGGKVPEGTLIVAIARDRVIAAVATQSGEALAEDTPEATAAVPVLRYTAGHLKHARPRPRRHGTPS